MNHPALPAHQRKFIEKAVARFDELIAKVERLNADSPDDQKWLDQGLRNLRRSRQRFLEGQS